MVYKYTSVMDARGNNVQCLRENEANNHRNSGMLRRGFVNVVNIDISLSRLIAET